MAVKIERWPEYTAGAPYRSGERQWGKHACHVLRSQRKEKTNKEKEREKKGKITRITNIYTCRIVLVSRLQRLKQQHSRTTDPLTLARSFHSLCLWNATRRPTWPEEKEEPSRRTKRRRGGKVIRGTKRLRGTESRGGPGKELLREEEADDR